MFYCFVQIIIIAVFVSSAMAADCTIKDNRPDPLCTPGVMMSEVTAKDVCTPLYTAHVRNVPDSEKKQVFAAYGMNNKTKPCPCEIDHFVSLELGGANDVHNLWPESYANPMGARVKDQVEDYLHRQVCKGNMTLAQAQKEITGNWKDVYARIHAK